MRPGRRASLVALLGLILAQLPPGVPAAEPDELLFCEVSHLNFAWGFQHSGVFIGPSGSIGEFRYGPEDSRWAPNRNEPMTIDELREKYRPGQRLIGRVCPDQMLWLRGQLHKVRYSPLSKPVNTMVSDGGTQFIQCWLFPDERKPAHRIVLREDGSYEMHSTAPDAPALANWLEAAARTARETAHIPDKRKGCISYPDSLQESSVVTLEPSPEMRDEARRILSSAKGLRCQFKDGHKTSIDGASLVQEPIPEVAAELNYDDLDFTKRVGRRVAFFDGMVEVEARLTPAGIALEDHEGEESVLTVHVAPYRIDGSNRFPAVMFEVMSSPTGIAATNYAGTCTVIPRS